MVTKDIMRKLVLREPSATNLPSLDLARTRPRAFEEWRAFGRWGQLPAREQEVPGYLLRAARENSGLTQRALGEKLRISQQAVAQAEKWSSNPTITFMRNWLKACGCDLKIAVKGRGR